MNKADLTEKFVCYQQVLYYGSDGGVVSKKRLNEDGFHESFSMDDWCWGAARGSVNCNGRLGLHNNTLTIPRVRVRVSVIR